MSRLYGLCRGDTDGRCARSSDELTIQHVFRDATVSHSMECTIELETTRRVPVQRAVERDEIPYP